MAIHRYWRLVGFCTRAAGLLELSEARLYENTVLADAGATLDATIAPVSGTLSDLRDGLATGVVAWEYAAWAQPGFALTWDFGAGAGVESAALRLGAGSNAAAFPLDFLAQYSDDAKNWLAHAFVVGARYPGALALTDTPVAALDPYAANVVLELLGGTLLDSSPTPKTLTVYGGVAVSTAQSHSGSPSLFFDGAGDYFGVTSASLAAGAGDFTVAGWAYLTGYSYSALMSSFNSGTGTGIILGFDNAGHPYFATGNGSGPSATREVLGTNVVPLHTWVHLEGVRSGTTNTLYVNGVAAGSITSTLAVDRTAMVIGRYYQDVDNHYTKGYASNLQLTIGVARHLSNFTPTTGYGATFLATDAATSRWRTLAPLVDRLLPAFELPVTTAHGHLREIPFFDVFNGGIGLITGTVKEKSLPANVPLARKVWLMDEASGMVVRETWSDVTGTYEFRGIRQGVKYTVLAYDYTGAYRAVVADRIIPETTP